LITLTVIDEAGGPGPVQFEDQFIRPPSTTSGFFILSWVTASLGLAIYTSDPVAQTVTVEALIGTTIPYHDWHRVKFMWLPEHSTGQRVLVSLDYPAMRDEHGVLVGEVEVPTVPPTANMMRNPLMRDWPPSYRAPVGWNGSHDGGDGSEPVIITRATAPGEWDTGGQAMRVTILRRMASWFSRRRAMWRRARRGSSVFRPNKGPLWCCQGRSRAHPRPGRARRLCIRRHIPDFPTCHRAVGSATDLDVWQDVGAAAAFDLLDPDLVPLPNAIFVVSMRISPVGTTPCEVLIDAAQVTNTPEQRPLFEGNGGVRLFQAANERLLRYATPAVTIDADVLDLDSFDPVAFPYDEFVLGGSIRVIDPRRGGRGDPNHRLAARLPPAGEYPAQHLQHADGPHDDHCPARGREPARHRHAHLAMTIPRFTLRRDQAP